MTHRFRELARSHRGYAVAWELRMPSRLIHTAARMTLPIIFPALGAAFALVFLDAMKELTATLLLSPTGLNTLATEVWAHTANVEFAAAAPYAALLIVVSGLPVYLLTTRMYLSR